MKRLIIIVLVLLLLGGGLGGLTTLKIIPDVLGMNALLAGLMGAAPEEPAAEAPPSPSDLGPAPVFVQVPQMAVPMIGDGLSRGHLVLAVRLSIAPEAVADVKRALPRLVDAYLTGLMQTLPETMGAAGRLDLSRVKGEMNSITESVLARGQVHDVVLQNAYIR